MNSKAMALLAVVVMIASGAVAFVSMPSEVEAAENGSVDSPYDLGTVYVDGSTSASVDVKYNQSAYAGLPYKVTLSANIVNTTGDTEDYTEIYSKTDKTIGSSSKKTVESTFDFTPSDSTSGVIAVTIEPAGAAVTSSNTVKFKLDVIINPDNSDGSSSLTLESVYYTLNVNVRVGGTLVVKATGDVTTFTENHDSTVNYNVKLDESDEGYITGTDYEWYAYNLPEGLSINATTDGFSIGGMPITAETKNVSIVARDKVTGAEYSYSNLSITVNEDGKTEITLMKDKKTLDPTGTNEYFVMSNGTEVIELKVESTATPKVSAIDDETMSREPLTDTDSNSADGVHIYTVPTGGAGVYYIEVSVGADVQVLKLNVVINPTGAPGAGFEIISTPSP